MVVASGCTILTEIPHQTEKPSGEAGGTTQGSHTEATGEPTSVPTQSDPEPEPDPEPSAPPESEPEEKVWTVCIDAGHQSYGISEKEPNGPGSTEMKAKLTSGTRGVATKIPEYQLTLDVSLLLEQELQARGYNVVMIRRTNDCPLSNAERAQVANESGADIFIRIHANGSEVSTVSGMLCCAPTQSNPYLSSEVISESIRLSQLVVDRFCDVTGARNRGLMGTDTMTGINWCQIPVTIVEMGFMSNPEEDKLMATDTYRALMVQGIADGIDAYFGE